MPPRANPGRNTQQQKMVSFAKVVAHSVVLDLDGQRQEPVPKGEGDWCPNKTGRQYSMAITRRCRIVVAK